jgi:hypothetical protein
MNYHVTVVTTEFECVITAMFVFVPWLYACNGARMLKGKKNMLPSAAKSFFFLENLPAKVL